MSGSRGLCGYSIDGGATYETIAVDHRATSLSVDRDSLAGSSRARLRVVVSDGTRSAAAESPVFTVAESPPEVFVRSPSTGAIFGGSRSIRLEATAHDPEDGRLDGSSIQWSSDIDGVIATSGVAIVDTSGLILGTHVLTATATDSSSMTGTATVTITVRAINEPPIAADDTGHIRAAMTAVVDVAANDTDIEGDIDPYSLAIGAPSAVGTATAVNNAGQFVSAVSYRAAAAGIDAVIYEICDRARQCTTAELTIVVTDDS